MKKDSRNVQVTRNPSNRVRDCIGFRKFAYYPFLTIISLNK